MGACASPMRIRAPSGGPCWTFRDHAWQSGEQGEEGMGMGRRGREGKEREGGEGKGGRWPQRLGCILAAGHCALPPTCSLSPLGRTRSRSRHASPYPATPETPTSLSWKWDWARFLIDSCWAEGWRGREVGRMGKKTPTHTRNSGIASGRAERAGLEGQQ